MGVGFDFLLYCLVFGSFFFTGRANDACECLIETSAPNAPSAALPLRCMLPAAHGEILLSDRKERPPLESRVWNASYIL